MTEQPPSSSPGADVPPRTVDELDLTLSGAALLGLELDTRYRVLAATLELSADRHPWPTGEDRRVQLLVSPVSTVLASLRRLVAAEGSHRAEVYTFGEDQLVDVAAAFDGAAVQAPLFGRSEPRPGTWAPEWSLQGRSTAGDGTSRTLTVSVRREDEGGELALDLFVRFDELQVRDPSGADLLVLGPPSILG